MRQYIRRIHNKENEALRVQLEHEIVEYNLGDKQIQEYYFGFMSLWIKYVP